MVRRVRTRSTPEPYYAEVETSDRVVVHEQVTEIEDGPMDLWPWIAGLGIALLLVVGYFATRDDDDAVVQVNNPSPSPTVVIQQPPVIVNQQPPVIVNQQPPVIVNQQPPAQSSAPAESAPASSAPAPSAS